MEQLDLAAVEDHVAFRLAVARYLSARRDSELADVDQSLSVIEAAAALGGLSVIALEAVVRAVMDAAALWWDSHPEAPLETVVELVMDGVWRGNAPAAADWTVMWSRVSAARG